MSYEPMHVKIVEGLVPRECLFIDNEPKEPSAELIIFLTQRLAEKGLKLVDVAEALGYHYDTIVKWRRGYRLPPTWTWAAFLRLVVSQGVLECK